MPTFPNGETDKLISHANTSNGADTIRGWKATVRFRIPVIPALILDRFRISYGLGSSLENRWLGRASAQARPRARVRP